MILSSHRFRFPILALALTLTACGLFEKKAPPTDKSPGSATATSSASAAGTPSAAAPAGLAVYPQHQVAAGKSPSGAWTGAFAVERQAGNEGLTLESAAKSCRDQGRSLCTQTQWERACESDAKLGELQTWTLSLAGKQAIVRGGSQGCAARLLSAPTQTSPDRVAVCCDRAVAIKTTNDNQSFLVSSAKRLLDYENAARRSTASKLQDLLDERVVYGGKERKPQQVVNSFERTPADAWTVLDTCKVAIDKDGSEARLVSDCDVVSFSGGTFAADTLRIVHGGPKSRIQLIGKEGDMALLGKEKKERVRSFLGGD